MKLYVVSADTYQECYGASISIFGVFSSAEKAEKCIKKNLKKKNNYNYEINEVNLDKCTELDLGGYFE